MTTKRLYLKSATNAAYLRYVVDEMEVGDQMRVGPPDRLLVQNARFHAMCGDVAKQKKYMGRTLKLAQWKILFISAHMIEAGEGSDIVAGFTGEFVNLRESSAGMSIKRMASLIEYVAAWGAQNEVKFTEKGYFE